MALRFQDRSQTHPLPLVRNVMPAHALRPIPAVTTAAAIVILSVGGALACAPCGRLPVKACVVAPPRLRVEQGPPEYDATVAALEARLACVAIRLSAPGTNIPIGGPRGFWQSARA
jgi:hypothetical protein